MSHTISRQTKWRNRRNRIVAISILSISMLVLALALGRSASSVLASLPTSAPSGLPTQASVPKEQPARPLADLLNPNGTVNLGTGFTGSLNTAGWTLESGLSGPPRFVQARAASGASDTRSNPVPSAPLVAGDEFWDARFGVPGQGMNGPVYAVAVSSNGTLYAGGNFSYAGTTPANNIATWNGSGWSALGSGMNGVVYSLAVSSSGTLYAGGLFTTAGGLTANNIATWHNGNWWPLGSGMDGDVLALAVSGTTLYAGGYFDHAGGLLVNNITAWNGSSWSALGSGMPPSNTRPSIVYSLAVSGNILYAGGDFIHAGGIHVDNIAEWDGSAWSAMGLGFGSLAEGGESQVYALVAVGRYVYAAGFFTFAQQPGTPLGLFVNNIAEWDGSDWLAMGAQPHTGVNGTVYALALGTFQNFPVLYVGGDLITDPGNMVAWSGVSWESILGSGTNHAVNALAMSGTDLNVGGDFTTAGAKPSMHFGIFHGGGNTPTSTPTRTSTQTNTPANTVVPTNTRTSTATGTATVTSTSTGTSTATNTATNTATVTNTATNTPVLTNSATITSTSTATRTATRTNTVTSTSVPVSTSTGTNTTTPTATHTSTTGPTGTSTNTTVPRSTPTATAIASSTSVQTATAAASGTRTSTNTALPGATGTATATASPSGTAFVSATTVSASATSTAMRTATATSTACTITFSDVPPDSAFYSYIRCLACRGIVSGYPDATFRPGNNVTRGQIAKMVSNAAGFSEDPGPRVYEDVVQGSTFYVWINRLSSRGYMAGYECGLVPEEPCREPNNYPYFRPNASATRGQISKIVSNAAGLTGTPTGQFYADVAQGHPFYLWIMRLTALGVISGYSCGGPGEPCDAQSRPYFRALNNVTRGQASKIVANTFSPNCQATTRK